MNCRSNRTHNLLRVAMIAVAVAGLAPRRAVAIDATVETWTGDVTRGRWTQTTADAVHVQTAGGDVAIPVADIMRIETGLLPRESAGPTADEAMLVLNDGSRLFGRLDACEGNAITLSPRWGDARRIPLNAVAAIRFPTTDRRDAQDAALAKLLADRRSDRDTLIATGGASAKTIEGVLDSIDDKHITFRWNKQTLKVSRDKCHALVLASGVDAPAAPPVRVDLRDGTRVGGALVSGDDETLTIDVGPSATATLPLNEIVAVAFSSPRVTYVSQLTPADYTFTPYFDIDWPWRADRSAANTPVRLDGRTYERGVGMRCGGTLTFDTQRRYDTFAATIGIDDVVRPRGEVIFRVLVDGREAFNSGPVRGDDAARTISVDVRKSKQITLVVDVGGMTDVGGNADWAAARLITAEAP